MKKKTRGQNTNIILSYLDKHGATCASDIQKATKVKGNIYTMLQSMVNRKAIVKVGMLYSLDRRMPLSVEKSNSLNGEKLSNAIHQSSPPPNPYANILKREHEHIMQGIQQLQITANYLNLRIKELERASGQ